MTEGGKLLKDEKFYYRYDGEGNLILKSIRNVLVPPSDATATGLTLNDYFKEGLHLISAICK